MQYAESSAPRSDYRSERSDDYVPGDTGYRPGHTGYDPPGVAEYQVPAATNAVQAASQRAVRRDPLYRPGGTSDYLPASGRRMSEPTDADRTAAARGAVPASYDAAADVRTAGPAGANERVAR